MGVHLKQPCGPGAERCRGETLVAALTAKNAAQQQADHDADGGLQLEENPKSDEKRAAPRRTQAAATGRTGLPRGECGGGSDDDDEGLALEDNGAAEGNDDGDGLALEDNSGGADGDAETTIATPPSRS